MPDSSMAVFFSAPEKYRSGDVEFPYHQNPNFFYLSGFNEQNSILIILKESIHSGDLFTNEFIFVQEKNPKQEVWTGKRLGVDVASKSLGFKATIPLADFAKQALLWNNKTILINGFDDYINYDRIEDESMKKAVEIIKMELDKNKYFENQYKKSSEFLQDVADTLREIKSQEEIVLCQHAIDITCLAHMELMKAMDTTLYEFQAQSIVECVFKREGAENFAFPSIIGSGENTCILHYTENRKKIFDGDLVVVDIGAEYHNYAADVTRTIPANGKYSVDQRLIYQLVYDAQNAGIDVCRKGNAFGLPGKEATKVIAEGLIKLGIIQKEKEVRRYFFHGTSHYLGLDVHDAGTYSRLAPGNIITVEPGIYIPEGSPCDKKWWNIGVRIEDDILITETGCINLSEKAPRTIEEIEKLMKSKSSFMSHEQN